MAGFSAKKYLRRPPTPFFSPNPTIGGLLRYFFRQILPPETSDDGFSPRHAE